jgi:hypothetical protein
VNCSQFAKLLAAGTALQGEGMDHLRACPTCSELAGIGDWMEGPASDPAVESRIIGAITTGLRPVDPLAPAWQYVLATLGLLVTVAAAGILVLGSAGWAADSILQRVYFAACLGGGILASAAAIAQLMIPGAFLLLTPARTIALGIVCTAAGALLYPAIHYDHFVRAIAVCIFIGLGHAAVACSLTLLVVRRGVFVSRLDMISMVALAGGLTGMAVLYVFCPHRDLGHVLLGHTPVPVAALAIGAWFGRKVSE